MKIKRARLEAIVREELARFIQSQLREAPRRATAIEDPTSSQDELPSEPIPDPEAAPEEQLPTDSPAEDGGMPPEGDLGDMPPITGGEPDPDEPDMDLGMGDEDAEDDIEDIADGGGEIADELEGKTIQSISMEPKSKIMPGAQEIVINFNETPDAFHVLLTKTGQFKFFFRGLHNDLGDQGGEGDEDIDGMDDLEGMMGGGDDMEMGGEDDVDVSTMIGPDGEPSPEEMAPDEDPDFGREEDGDQGPTLGKKSKKKDEEF
jgi:hypothetical protein